MTRIILYVHASRESAYNAGVKAGLTGEALERFMYAGDEHEITYTVDPLTGEATAWELDGCPLIRPET